MLPRTTRRLLPVAAVLLAATALAGCDQVSSDPDAAGAPAKHKPAKHATTPAPAPSSPAASPTASQRTTAAPAPTLADALLPASELPSFNEQLSWRETGTADTEPKQLFGTCQKFAFTSIGAMEVAVRDYEPASGTAPASGGELVAEFADPKTAQRAYEVLKSWRGTCDLSDYRVHDVHELQSVPVDQPDAAADWYLLVYGPPKDDTNAGYFDAQGFARVGNRIAAVALRVVGQDYDYQPGHEPMVDALHSAAARLS
jgi:hypothetical protein